MRGICIGLTPCHDAGRSRRRPPEALKTLAGVGGSDRRQVNGISRLIRMSIRVHFFPADPSLENATTGTPPSPPPCAEGALTWGFPTGVAAVISRNGTITLNYVLKLVTNFAIRARLLPRTEIADDAVAFDAHKARSASSA